MFFFIIRSETKYYIFTKAGLWFAYKAVAIFGASFQVTINVNFLFIVSSSHLPATTLL